MREALVLKQGEWKAWARSWEAAFKRQVPGPRSPVTRAPVLAPGTPVTYHASSSRDAARCNQALQELGEQGSEPASRAARTATRGLHHWSWCVLDGLGPRQDREPPNLEGEIKKDGGGWAMLHACHVHEDP